MNFYLGIDFGKSGARAIVIDADNIIKAEAEYSFASISGTDLAGSWRNALFSLIGQIPQEIRKEINAIAINGTSSTVLLCDASGNPLAEPILYHDGRGVSVMAQLKAIAPPNHVVLSATSSLAKLLWLSQNSQVTIQNYYFLHQGDWLAFLLHGKIGISDYHNALKLGYDPETLAYPDWMEKLSQIPILPQVLAPGEPIAEITPEIANKLGLARNCLVCAGTTDSIAAFLASGAKSPGEAVTSLGSTLVLKLLSCTRIEDARYGIYSHRLGDLWLTGGASNTGGAVLRVFFSDDELASLSREINPNQDSLLDYYPLLKPGERFPINNPNLPPRMEPKPAKPGEFLHGLLESIARIEDRGYQLLQELGATQLTHVYTAGGAAKNMTWSAIRARRLQVPILLSSHTEAAYGTALLSKSQLDGLS